MRSVKIVQDGEPLMVVVVQDGKPIAQHMLMAMGPNGALAYVKGGWGVPDAAPTTGVEDDDTTPQERPDDG